MNPQYLLLTPNATNATAYTITLQSGQEPEPEHGPLCRLTERLWKGRLWWLGNLVSNLRYWLWRLCR